ncbi:hypothetical protein Tco_1456021 [Tanacetum coccineum]
MCPRPLRPISTKLILVIDTRWSKSDSTYGFHSRSEFSAKVKKQFQRGNNFNQNRGKEQFQPMVRFIDLRFIHQLYQPAMFSSIGPAPQKLGVSKTDFERYVTANDAVLRNMQKPGQKPAIPNGKFKLKIKRYQLPEVVLTSKDESSYHEVEISHFSESTQLHDGRASRSLNPIEQSVFAKTSVNGGKFNCQSVLRNVYGGEIPFVVGMEAITFNLDQTSKFTADYDHMTAKQNRRHRNGLVDEYIKRSRFVSCSGWMFQLLLKLIHTLSGSEGDILLLEAYFEQ